MRARRLGARGVLCLRMCGISTFSIDRGAARLWRPVTLLPAISRPHGVHRPCHQYRSNQRRDGDCPTALRWSSLVGKIVFLKFMHKNGTYFIDGRLEEGGVTRGLVPVLDLKCTGSRAIEDAGVELRLFRHSPHCGGVRLIGRVLQTPGKRMDASLGKDSNRSRVERFHRDGFRARWNLPCKRPASRTLFNSRADLWIPRDRSRLPQRDSEVRRCLGMRSARQQS